MTALIHPAASLVLAIIFLVTTTTANLQPSDYLDESSVVLITGMAGFIGSELAMALHRVYSVKKVIGIDSMDSGFGEEKGRTSEQLGVFDYKRQRLFRVLQTLGEKCHFYRTDLRPEIPDFQNNAEVHVLDSIFSSHPDITHVIHLADPYGVPSLLDEGEDEVVLKSQAVPRKKGQIKAGMMEALLEQLRKAGTQHPLGRTPHFTYASSGHVYNHYDFGDDAPNKAPFAEEKPISVAPSIHGTSKLLDEILAKTYHRTRGIFSVGLRFFDVYGPWGSPGSFPYDMAERAVRGGNFVTREEEKILDMVVRDYIYIDDAVDAIMAAMQYRPKALRGDKAAPPVVINVGTGQGTTVRTIAEMMQRFLSTTVKFKLPYDRDGMKTVKRSVSFASTARAKELLGFESRVSLTEGLYYLLAWHHDRAFPYGNSDQTHPLESQGIVGCSPFDTECLRGAPVFPCASECAHRLQCTPSLYDSVLETTRELTAMCDAILYTVDLDDELGAIPSATAAVSSTSQSHVVSDVGHCNIAFVSSFSPLARNLREKRQTPDKPLKHGFWTLVLVDVENDQRDFFLEFLPKLSPGHFFGFRVKRVIYCDPDVIIDSIPNLLNEAAMQPLFKASNKDNDDSDNDNENIQNREGATAMLIGKGRQSQSSRKAHTPLQEAVQENAYRSVRIGVIDQMSGEGFALPLDSSFIVHTLQSEDSRLFRCDVFGELIQWDVGIDQSAFEFILELHDMWSSVIVKNSGLEPWWAGDGVVTIPEQKAGATDMMARSKQRNLLETAPDEAVTVQGVGKNVRSGQLLQVQDSEMNVGNDQGGQIDNFDETDGVSETEGANKQAAKRDANFGDGDDQVGDHPPDAAGAEVMAARKNDKDDDTMVDDDNNEEEDAGLPSRPDMQSQRDVSAYDTWMGVLSSTDLQYFVRIVPSSEAGVVVLDDYDS